MLPYEYYRSRFTLPYAGGSSGAVAARITRGLGVGYRFTGEWFGGQPVYLFTGTGAALWELYERVSATASDWRRSMVALLRSVEPV